LKQIAVASVLLLLVMADHSAGQVPGPDVGDGIRFGVSVGGSSRIALNLEFFRDSRSIEVALGTWRFNDVSLSTAFKQYIGGSAARPVVGAGLWLVGAGGRPGQRTGWALAFNVPVGLDWEITDPHAVGAFVNVNRGLWVRRSNPEDTAPMNKRIVPLPQLYYRIAR
jgi:hypothetical protein